MEIKEALKKYHKEYETDEEALNHAEAAIKDLKARTGTASLSDGGRDIFQGRYRTIGESVVRRYIHDGGIQFIGEKVENPAKLAALMQAYRNPLFETLRLIYLKDEHVLAAESFSNHLPDLTVLPFKDDEMMEHIKMRMDTLNADGYYIVHNYPSGNPKPSLPDQQLTYTVARHTEGFRGHVVTNHLRYALLDDKAEYEMLQMDGDTKDKFTDVSIEHPLIGKTVQMPTDIAEIGRELQTQENPNVSCMVYLTASNEIRMVQEVSSDLFMDARLNDWMAEQMYGVGASGICCITSNMDVYDACTPYMEQKYLKDAVFLDPDYPFYWSKKEEGIKGKSEYISAGKTEKDIRQYTSYQQADAAEPGSRKIQGAKRPQSRSL